jgi:hypothetical protein
LGTPKDPTFKSASSEDMREPFYVKRAGCAIFAEEIERVIGL